MEQLTEQLSEQIKILDKLIRNLEKRYKSQVNKKEKEEENEKVNNKEETQNEVRKVNEIEKENETESEKPDINTGKRPNTEELSLSFSKHRNKNYQYYLVDKKGHRTYIKKKEMDKARKIAQREYDKSVLKTSKELLYRATQFLKLYDFSELEKIYDELNEARKRLVEPVIMPIDQYISEWRKLHPGGANSFPFEEEFITDCGEMVRSKSEKIIADLFKKYDIPYVCEPEVTLFNGKCAYPDFAVLNKRTRKTYYWEHFGRIDFEDYCKRNFNKLNEYEKSDVLLMENLLVSMESKTMPLDIKQIEEKIKRYLL